MIRVDGTTELYAVIGHPVAHSRSPAMQNAAFAAAGMNALYVALDVRPEDLSRALDGLHAAGVRGLNATLPHKEAAARACAVLSPEARRAGGSNTLRWEREGWSGHATDGLGFRAWIAERGIALAGARVLLLGAGGAARAIAPVVAGLGAAALCVVSRSGGHAQGIVAELRLAGTSGIALQARPLDEPPAARGVGPFDLLVRAISAEGVGHEEAAWWAGLAPGAPVLDLNYAERADATRSRAAREGRSFADGLGLLLHQGAFSFEFWTGRPAPLHAMRGALGG